MFRFCMLVVPTMVLAGCVSQGFNRTDLYTRIQNGDLKIEVTDSDVAKAQELKPQLAFPCKIAVYLSPRNYNHWTAKDRAFIEDWGKTLKKEGIASDIFLMSELFASGTSLKEMRLAAAKHGANALLVIQGGSEVASSLNMAAVLNLTVLGGFVIPASHRDALFVLQGGLVDVSNEFLYASIESEGEGHHIRPTFLIENQPAIDEAKQKAFENFGPELFKRLRAVQTEIVSTGQPRTTITISGLLPSVAP